MKTTLKESGGKVSKIDPAVFFWHNSNGLAGILAVHVDDFLWTGTKQFERTVIVKIRQMFNVGKEASDSFKYLGLGLSQEDDQIILSQKDYVNMLQTIPFDKQRTKTSLLSSNERSILRSKVGQLL